MEDNNSYHGALSGEDAIKRLKKAAADAYLTRFSRSYDCYILTLLKRSTHAIPGHFKLAINRNTQRYFVHGMEKTFGGMDELLAWYENNRIHPLFDTIGRRLTVQEYTHIMQKRCILQ